MKIYGSREVRSVFGWALAILGISMASPAAAQNCSALKTISLESGKVVTAAIVPAGDFKMPAAFGPPPGVAAAPFEKLPAFCRVQANLRPSADSDIKVEIWLPLKGWNGKFVGIGNGVWAGSSELFRSMGDPLSRGYAVATTDTGHTGTGLTAEWAAGHPEKLVDFGYRAVHGMTIAAKR